MRVVIIEDEKLSAEHLALLLQKTDSSITVVSYIETVREAVNAFTAGLEADLLFVDIHLADGNSFDIFSTVDIDIPIIFTTAFDQYAITAFKQNSIDYLLKPITLKDVQFALDKFKKQQQVSDALLKEKVKLIYSSLNNEYKSRFLVKKGQSIDYIPIEDIPYFETRESISFLVNTKGFRFPVDYTLDEIERMVSPTDFFRINRKIIIHIKAIEKVETYLNGRLNITCKQLKGDSCIVSRERVSDFKKWLDK